MTNGSTIAHGELSVLTEQYRYLGKALCGRELSFAHADNGTLTHTDGSRIYLRRGLDTSGAVKEIAVQCALLAAGSLGDGNLFSLIGRPARTRRYLALEAQRALRSCGVIFSYLAGDLLEPQAARTDSPQESLARSAESGLPEATDPRLGVIYPLRLLRSHDSTTAALSADLSVAPRLSGDQTRNEELDDDEEAEDITSLARKLSGIMNTPLGNALRDILGMRRSPGKGAGGGGEGDPVGAISGSSRIPSVGARANYSVAMPEPESGRLVGRWVYPEWDGHKGHYLPQWCSVHEFPASWMNLETSGTIPSDTRIEKQVHRLTPARTPTRRQDDGPELDLDALIDQVVDQQLSSRLGQGSFPERSPVYVADRRRRRDLSVLILLDMSGSGKESGASSSIFAEQARSAAILARSFSVAGDRVALLAFHSHGRNDVRAVTLKNFDGHWSHTIAQQTMSLKPSGYTRLGAAIRHATYRLLQARANDYLQLIVISDGFPYDFDYQGHHAVLDLKQAVHEVKEQQVGLLWICFGKINEALRPMLDLAHHQLLTGDRLEAIRAKIVPYIARNLNAGRRKL